MTVLNQQKQKPAAYYKTRPTEIDLTNLVVIPEAPRVSGSAYPKNWDWRILESAESSTRSMKKSRSVDVDSAFGSSESSPKTEEGELDDVGVGIFACNSDIARRSL